MRALVEWVLGPPESVDDEITAAQLCVAVVASVSVLVAFTAFVWIVA